MIPFMRQMLQMVLLTSFLLAGGVFLGAASQSFAISPEEQLPNPILEDRARGLSAQLRCLVCQNQSIDDSDADLAVDLRKQVRAQITAGLDDETILDNLQATYGDYILLNPPVNPATYLLWAAPFLLLGAAFALFWHYRRFAGSAVADMSKGPEFAEEPSAPASDKAPISPKALGALAVSIMCASFIIYSQLGQPEIAAQPLSQ